MNAKPTQQRPGRRIYPWQRAAANTPTAVSEPIRPPAIVAQVPRVTLGLAEI